MLPLLLNVKKKKKSVTQVSYDNMLRLFFQDQTRGYRNQTHPTTSGYG